MRESQLIEKMSLALAVLILFSGSSRRCSAQKDVHREKKLIEWGWDEPGTKFLRSHADAMQAWPFDGVVFHLDTTGDGDFLWEAWGGRRFEHQQLEQAISDLRTTSFGKLTDNFLRFNVTPGTATWFDEEKWGIVLHNTELAAEAARHGRCEGLLLDTEQYQGEPFRFQAESGMGLTETRLKVRERGNEWMRAVIRKFPDATVFLTFGYATAQPRPGKDAAVSDYALLPDFLDGVLSACGEENVIVDGWERAYGYQRCDQFENARKTILEEAVSWTGLPEQYRKHVRAGFGLWMDYNLKDHGWHPTEFAANYFSPAEFEAAVRCACQTSDRYVWIYTEQPRWWTNEKVPTEYRQALELARRPVGVGP